ncbi:MAG: hypothetical protein HY909_19680 [Deltaproteobacteria bacterium]|nr:hypothetical protein [Deltaproteobacteria bacterium]
MGKACSRFFSGGFALAAAVLVAAPAWAQEFRYVRTVPTGMGVEASYFDSERGHVAVFNPSGAGRFLRTDGTLLRTVSAPSTGFLDAAAYDTIGHRALFLTQDCTLTEANPETLTMTATRRLGHGMSICAGLGVGRDNNLYIASYGTNEVVVLDRTGATLVRRIALASFRFSGIDGLAYIPGSDNILVASSTGAGAAVISPTGAVVIAPGAIGAARPLQGTTISVPDGLTSLCANGHVWLCEAYSPQCYDFQQTTGDRSTCGCHETGGANACGGATPICDDDTNNCRGCLADSECLGGTPVCDTASGRCVLCTTMNARACARSPDGRACIAAAGVPSCGCATDGDCGGATSGRVCDPMPRRCADGCSTAPGRNGCPAGLRCTSTGSEPGRCEEVPDAAPMDTTPDTAPDTTPDTTADTTPDTVLDTAPEAATDTAPEVAQDLGAADTSRDDTGPQGPQDTSRPDPRDAGADTSSSPTLDAGTDAGTRPPATAEQGGSCGCRAAGAGGGARWGFLAAWAAAGYLRRRSSRRALPRGNDPRSAGNSDPPGRLRPQKDHPARN